VRLTEIYEIRLVTVISTTVRYEEIMRKPEKGILVGHLAHDRVGVANSQREMQTLLYRLRK